MHHANKLHARIITTKRDLSLYGQCLNSSTSDTSVTSRNHFVDLKVSLRSRFAACLSLLLPCNATQSTALLQYFVCPYVRDVPSACNVGGL